MPTTADILLRDHVRYTGDGKPNEPVGKPAPHGDPSSGTHNPSKKDLRDAVNSVTGAADEADAAAARADAAAGRADTAAADLLPYRGQLAGHIARMKAGEAVTIVCYGDSTTDGNGTTGWTANPVNGDGTAIGTAAHNPPNAWPAAMRTIIRRMFGNDQIAIWNAGYGGHDLVTGWAINNFQTAVIDNPGYGVPDICLLNWGLNDIVRGVYTPAYFKTQLKALILEIVSHGITPVLMTPDPVMEAGLRQGGSISELIQVYREVAEEQAITLIDTHDALQTVFSAGGTNSLWAYNQQDDLHFNDAGHRVKASYVSACLFPNTLWVDAAEPINIAPWSRHSNTHGLTYSLFDEVNNRFGASVNVEAGTYTTGQVLMDVWVWTKTPRLNAFWRSVSGDGYYNPAPLADAPEIEAASYLTAATVAVKSPTAGATQPAADVRGSETPSYLAQCTAGLNRLTFKAPTDVTTRTIFLGYFCLRPADPPSSFAAYWAAGGSGKNISNGDAFEVNAPLIGSGFTRSFNILVDVVMPDGAGVFIYTGRAFEDGTGGVSQRHRGIVLQRSGANAVLLDVVYTASSVVSATSLASGAYAWSETSNEFNIRGGAGDGTQHVLQVTPAATPLAPILDVTRARTVAPWPLGGRMGAFYKDYAVSAAPGRSRIIAYGI